MLKYSITRTPNPRSAAERAAIFADPGFGKHFTEHMVAIDWDKDAGWHDAQVRPYGPLSLDPAASVLHYGQEIFEGIKAYRHADGSIWTFRPEANGERLQRSARRLALPELPVDEFVQSLRQLVAVDADWVPGEPETSLGASGFGYELARRFGHALRPTRAGLVPLTLSGSHQQRLADLSGVSLEVEARCNGHSFREALLFTHRGVSGPAILQISSYWQPGDELRLDLLPGRDAHDWLCAQRRQRPDACDQPFVGRHDLQALLGTVQQAQRT